ncbi:MAG: bacteriohemerythrin [Nitrospiraceae bacterium]|nr:bacteriohemerythrin [Nitrospiraceae bacterium]
MEWTEDLAVGIIKIDEQHKELFKRINDLLLAIREQRCRAEIDKTIEFLDDYARFHFSEEEQRMEEAGYKGLQEQKLQHAVYLKNIAELKHQASLPRESGMSYELSVTATQIVVDWIVNHIMNTDKLFGVYLRQLNA